MKKTVLITGCSSGIGKAAVSLFASKGWNVVATMRDVSAGAEWVGLEGVLVARLDVEDLASIDAAIGAGIARFGKIDVLINNAGFGQYGLFEAISREQIQKQFDVNVFGVMDVTRALLPHFRANKGGMIINVSSGAGLFTIPMISMYCASKFALEGFSEAISYELASQNILVKLVEPHGGVAGTAFGVRSGAEYARDASLGDYDSFVQRMDETFAKMSSAHMAGTEDVAAVVYEAATDGTDRLRYLVGTDERGFVKARYGLSEGEYVAYMRAQFLG